MRRALLIGMCGLVAAGLSAGCGKSPDRKKKRDAIEHRAGIPIIPRGKVVVATAKGERWIRVITADGRLGWLKQLRTVPARVPSSPRRWRDVKDRGGKVVRSDRRMVRPRPR